MTTIYLHLDVFLGEVETVTKSRKVIRIFIARSSVYNDFIKN